MSAFSAVRPGLIGFATGLRSSLGPAAVAAGSSRSYAFPLAGVAVLGELITDKLPTTPSRLMPGPLGARLVLGGGTAAWLARRGRGDGAEIVIAAVTGIAAAGLGSVAGARWRGWAAGPLRGDLAGALIEDAVAVALAGFAAGIGHSAHR